MLLKTNYGSETVIPLYITGCRENQQATKPDSCNIFGDTKKYHRLRTVISVVSGFFLTLCTS